MSLTFDEASHTYRFNGEVRPSVTQCLGKLHDFNMVPRDVLEAACLRGTYVHTLCEFHDQKDLDPASIGDYWPYLDAWIDFTNDMRAEWSGIEFQAYSTRFGFAGTLDRYGSVQGSPYVIDIKTSAQPHRVWGMQLAAYRQLLAEHINPTWALARRATVQLGKDGKYKFIPWDSPTDWTAFQALITLMNWTNE